MMTASVPRAAWYVKLDTDTFFNIQRLRISLVPPSAIEPPHYVGKPMRVFSYKRAPLTYMQGGAYVLSHTAAQAVATCQHAPRLESLECAPTS